MDRLRACAELRKQKSRGRLPFLDPQPHDLVEIDTLSAAGYRKARHFLDIGELPTVTIAGRRYATRAELADWGAMDFEAGVTPSGRFLGG